MAWSYIYGSGNPVGLGTHADPAAVNCNLWLAPDSANNDPDGGGLVVYEAAGVPGDVSVYNWGEDSQAEKDRLLRETGHAHVVVPHRQNRMVLFDSSKLHRTMELDFQRGWTNRRINFTMLFGDPPDSPRAFRRGLDVHDSSWLAQ